MTGLLQAEKHRRAIWNTKYSWRIPHHSWADVECAKRVKEVKRTAGVSAAKMDQKRILLS